MPESTIKRFDFVDERRYGTDCGPRCPACGNKGPVAGDTMWIMLVYPGQASLATCVAFHHTFTFQAPGETKATDHGMVETFPDIAEVKLALTNTLEKL